MTYVQTVTFERIVRSGTKSGKCEVCGKKASRSTSFGQTLNPWNKNKATGELKSRREISDELNAKVRAWEAEPVRHAKCE
jgi:hypothetical protein